jgi:hypothetical protein
MGPHAFVFFLRSCTNVMNVTAAAVDELAGAKACMRVNRQQALGGCHMRGGRTSMVVGVDASKRN